MVAAIEQSGRPTRAEFHEAISSRSDRWFSACLRITRNTDLAEDAVQEALLSAWHKREQFQRSSSLETWIHRIAVNAALQLVRKERPSRFQPLATEMIDEADSPEQCVTERDLGTVLSAAFSHLSDIERVCFVLKHIEQWRLKEIADELGTNVDVVRFDEGADKDIRSDQSCCGLTLSSFGSDIRFIGVMPRIMENRR